MDDVILFPLRISDLDQMIRQAVNDAFSLQGQKPQPAIESEILNIEELSVLTGYQKGYLHKLVHERKLPFYKPQGGRLYFLRSEILTWIKNSRRATRQEISQAVNG